MTQVASARHHMNVWGDEDCSLVRFNLSGRANLELDDLLHDDTVFLAFEGCHWASRNGPRTWRQERPGDVIVRPAGESFSITAEWIASTGGVCREVHISQRRMAQLAQEEESPLARIDLHQGLISDPALAGGLIALHARFEQAHDSLEASEALAGWLGRLAGSLSPVAERPRARACQRGIARVIEYLRAHFNENLSLDDLAAVAQMNRFILLRQFRNAVGVTPHQYQRIRRVVAAKRHLRAGVPLAEIATICGFCDQSHMTREFKRRTGLTPTAFIPRRPHVGARATATTP